MVSLKIMTISPLLKAYSILLVLLQFISIGLLLLIEPFFSSGLLLITQVLAVIVGVFGVFSLQLGKFNIEPIPKSSSQLYTAGIYKFIRHPMYLSIFMFFSPIMLLTINLYSWLIFAVLTITLLAKIHFEEKLLQQKFPKYADYKKNSKKLIPFIF